MKKIGIFYGSTTGTTESVAEQIASHLGVGSSEVYNVGNTDAKVAEEYELLILGSSTWGSGELQDDWYDFLEQLAGKNLSGKKIALFGLSELPILRIIPMMPPLPKSTDSWSDY